MRDPPATSKQCRTDCLDSFYGNTATNECDPCDLSCLTCNGPNPGDCLSCADTAAILNPDPGPGTCACPDGQYDADADAGMICSPCDGACTL